MAQKHVCLSQHLHKCRTTPGSESVCFPPGATESFTFIIFDVVVRGGGGGLGRPGLIDIKAHTHSHRCAPAYKHTHACSNVLMDRRLWHSNSSRTDLCQALGVWLHVTIKIKQSCRHNHIIQAFFFPALTYRPSPPALKSRVDAGGFCFTRYVSRQAVRRLLWLY